MACGISVAAHSNDSQAEDSHCGCEDAKGPISLYVIHLQLVGL